MLLNHVEISLTVFIVKKKYKSHIEYCKNRKPKNYYPVLKNICNLKI